eukprot:TRINITY_DN3360_c1_g1_i1.p2 TRINITY_DN3360_c1_g1~~TRINITY_DN3360_c1_g1_i1.p2  ORF type:complete len:286 (-),score=30.02 TRINITY_DN3360_c1_g1_i1:330-1187(-)
MMSISCGLYYSNQPQYKRLSVKSCSVGVRRDRSLKQTVQCDTEFEKLKGCIVQKVSTGQEIPLSNTWQASLNKRCIVSFLTHFGDLTTWEYGQKLAQEYPLFEQAGIDLVMVGLGDASNARAFQKYVGLPVEFIHADETGQAYEKMGFSKGFAPDADVNPYLKLLPMLMGIGSPGTIGEVLRGYFGDRNAPQVFKQDTPFDVLGKEYQRPFELATLRLQNMIGVLSHWDELAPKKTDLLTYQGGTLIFEGEKCIWKHMDSGILKYANFEDVKKQTLSSAVSQTVA